RARNGDRDRRIHRRAKVTKSMRPGTKTRNPKTRNQPYSFSWFRFSCFRGKGDSQMLRRTAIAVAILACGVRPTAAQNVETDPIQCWWRTSSGAVRVGESFSLVLTCAVVENDAAKVIVDQSKLEPSVIQLAPFEVTGGSHGADLRAGERRFFQYEYRLRL